MQVLFVILGHLTIIFRPLNKYSLKYLVHKGRFDIYFSLFKLFLTTHLTCLHIFSSQDLAYKAGNISEDLKNLDRDVVQAMGLKSVSIDQNITDGIIIYHAVYEGVWFSRVLTS